MLGDSWKDAFAAHCFATGPEMRVMRCGRLAQRRIAAWRKLQQQIFTKTKTTRHTRVASGTSWKTNRALMEQILSVQEWSEGQRECFY